ncbi:MAG TPA: hypothetical protein VLO11_09430 [Luteolibacter sp.]|nr:hypothetical protein [Luteolibacter sp.]
MIFALGACSLFEREEADSGEKEREPVKGPELVGRIASVSSDRRFVLIQSYGPWKRAAGAILTARGEDDRVANLLVTGESMGRFAAADIQSGTVATGDAVYSLHTPAPPEPTVDPAANPEAGAEAAGNQSNEGSGNVQKNN